MGPYCSFVSVALGSHNLIGSRSKLNLEHDKYEPEEGIWSSCSYELQQAMKLGYSCDVAFVGVGFGATGLTKFGKHENRLQFVSPHLPVRLCYHDRTCTKMEPFPLTLWWSPHYWWHPIQIWRNLAFKSTMVMKNTIICISREKRPSIKYPPITHYCFNFLQRCKVYSKKHPPNWARAESFEMQHDVL